MSDKTLTTLIKHTQLQIEGVRREVTELDQRITDLEGEIQALEAAIAEAYTSTELEYTTYIQGFVQATNRTIIGKRHEQSYYKQLQSDKLENLHEIAANQKRFEILQSKYRRQVKYSTDKLEQNQLDELSQRQIIK